MTPFLVLAASFLLFRALGALGLSPFRSWVTSLRWALAGMFVLTASAHFGARRPDLVRMVPPAFPHPELLVTLTGIAELLGAAGLLVPRLAPWAASGLALLLAAMFPANVHAARAGLTIGDVPVTPLVPRAILQVVFLAAMLVAGFRRGPRRGRPGGAARPPAGGSPVATAGARPPALAATDESAPAAASNLQDLGRHA
jgi:uncharacterized membrane protein